MPRRVKLWRDPYGEDFELFQKKSVTFKPGLTVLVGCNGIGKSTLLRNIKSELKENKIPVLKFDNLTDAGNFKYKGFDVNFEYLASSLCSSEGEGIVSNMIRLAEHIGLFVKTGEYDLGGMNRLSKALKTIVEEDNTEEEITESNERWILLDAVDSGLSVDNIVELKEYLFKPILEHSFGKEIYIIVSANEYEMTREEQCFDVFNCKYIKFKSYDDYRNMILKSRENKESRYKKDEE